MGLRRLFYVALVGFALNLIWRNYLAFKSPRCPEGQPAESCLTPLFDEGEHVDVFVYLTSKSKLKWWTQPGLDELRRVPFWNQTGLQFGKDFRDKISLPLSVEQLQGARRNDTHVYAHFFLLRAGTKLESLIRKLKSAPTSRFSALIGTTVGTDVLHAQAPLTKWMPQRPRHQRFALLGGATANATNRNASTEDTGVVNKGPVWRSLPYFGAIPINPDEASRWVALFYGLCCFCSPTLVTAAIRHALHVVGAWLFTLWQEQQVEHTKLLRVKAKNDAMKLKSLRDNTKITLHMVPEVRLAVAMDGAMYDPRGGAPVLFHEFVFDDRSPMPVGENVVNYNIAQRGGPRYSPPAAVDAVSFTVAEWIPIDTNASKPDPEVEITFNNVGIYRYSMIEMCRQAIRMYLKVGFTEKDVEELQDVFFRHPVHVLVIMQVIGLLQMLLTTLAFKNDISFFRGRENYQGLSSRTLGTDVLHELVIFLHLMDFPEMSRLILFQVGVGSLIDVWKYVRVAQIGISFFFFLPWITHNRGAKTNKPGEADTEEIDARGMRILTYALYPLSVAWGVYDLYRYPYRSWWSWAISSAAKFAYTFGFVNMFPQLFINYKLKSVAHMPWRVLIYKFFRTFIDDVFAWFVMYERTTPMYRWMTMRDDIVFFVFLYQYWAYRIDYSRPDEFGFVYGEGNPPGTGEIDSTSKTSPMPISSQSEDGSSDLRRRKGDSVMSDEARGDS